MEKVLVAIHQAVAGRGVIRLEYGHHQGEVGLFCRFPTALRRFILEPLAAKYPDCRFAEVSDADGSDVSMPGWYADLRLVPDLYPILRHAQFKDMLTGNYEDPIDAILKAVQPGEGIVCRNDGQSSGVAPPGPSLWGVSSKHRSLALSLNPSHLSLQASCTVTPRSKEICFAASASHRKSSPCCHFDYATN